MTLDAQSKNTLAATGLEYRQIDRDDHNAVDAHLRSAVRGFLGGEPREEVLTANHKRQVETNQRSIGVYDPRSEQQDFPVATIASWPSLLTTPGSEIPLWAISELTVSPTHRRRGIARAMVEGELRDAARAGTAVVGLTVSEATIYSRYGFGPATWHSNLQVDARRAGWRSLDVSGSFHYVSLERLAEYLVEISERSRSQYVGSVNTPRQVFRQRAGLESIEDHKNDMRGVVYLDADGIARGAMPYRVKSDNDWVRSDFLGSITSETPEAHAALWQFAVQHDLIGTVRMNTCAVDDPIFWLVHDRRAISAETYDDHWLRILDTKSALEGRRYRAPLSVTLRVNDELGFAGGSWQFETQKVDDTEYGYAATLTPVGDANTPAISIDVADLASLYLGGIAVSELADAGRIGGSAADLNALDLAFRAVRAPLLRVGY